MSTEKEYVFGYSPAAIDLMTIRTAEMQAGFLLPHLTPGLRLLDIGCGPGTITVGLAQAVAPGATTGLDVSPGQVEMARRRAAEAGQDTCDFVAGDARALPFEAGAFDVVFGHTILLQFGDPAPVLSEVRRVLRPEGIAAFREIDIGASLFAPEDDALGTVMGTMRRAIREGGGDPDIGRDLPRHLAQAGFEIVSARPVFSASPTPEARAGLYKGLGALWDQAEFPAKAIAAGWLSEQDRAEISGRMRREADDLTRLAGIAYVEIVARAPG